MNNATPNVNLREATWVWLKIAALSFGGPAGQIATMHRILVEEKRWIDDSRFLHALNYCMLLPGPEAQQLAIYIGWLLNRKIGGVIAGTLFILPGFVAILALSIIYTSYGNLTTVQGLFFGLKSAVIAIVFSAFFRISKRVLKSRLLWCIAIGAFTASFFFQVPFPAILVIAGLVGLSMSDPKPKITATSIEPSHPSSELAAVHDGAKHAITPSWKRNLQVIAFFLCLWFTPLVILRSLGQDFFVYRQLGEFFSKTAVVTFGGAYSVLSYIGQKAVSEYHWLAPGEMIDGLGMAETTPGPLIMVVQFVGYMAAYRNPGSLHPVAAGVYGSLITVWVTFVPCFFWVFLGAPYMERLRTNQRLNRVLSAITAAVSGVILNLAIWFSMHTLFRSTQVISAGPLHLELPNFASLHLAALAITILAFVLNWAWRKNIAIMLLACCAAGIALQTLSKV